MTHKVQGICIGISFPGDSATALKEISQEISQKITGYHNKLSLRHPMLKITFCMEVSKEELKKVETIIRSVLEKRISFFITIKGFILEEGKLSMIVESDNILEDIRFEIFSEMEKLFPKRKRVLEKGLEKLFIPKVTLGIIPTGAEVYLQNFILSKDFSGQDLENICIQNLHIFRKGFPSGEWESFRKFKIKSMTFRALAEARG